MPEPVDKKLYDTIKKRIYKKQPKHSAYRSGKVVKEYKKKFTKKDFGAIHPSGTLGKNLSQVSKIMLILLPALY